MSTPLTPNHSNSGNKFECVSRSSRPLYVWDLKTEVYKTEGVSVEKREGFTKSRREDEESRTVHKDRYYYRSYYSYYYSCDPKQENILTCWRMIKTVV